MFGTNPVHNQKVEKAFHQLMQAYPTEKAFRNFVANFVDRTPMDKLVKEKLKSQPIEDVKDFVYGMLVYFDSHGLEIDLNIMLNEN